MADAIVIGGGVMGLAAACELRRRGHTVTLLERAQPGRAASWASAGIIGATLRDESDPSYHLRRVSRDLWPAFADAVHTESGMDPEYREMGCIQLASDGDEFAALERAARRRRDDDVDLLDQEQLRRAAQRRGDDHVDLLDQEELRRAAQRRGDDHVDLLDQEELRGAARRGDDDVELLDQEQLRRAARRRGDDVHILDQKQLRELEPALSPNLAGGMLVPGGNVDNRRLCKALEIAARRAGVQIETGVEVVSIATTGGKVAGVEISPRSAPSAGRQSGRGGAALEGQQVSRQASVGQGLNIRGAELVVLAAGAWSATIANLEPTPPVAPQRGQILALDQASVGVKHVLLTPGDPYFVPRADGRLVIGATREEASWDPSLTAGGIAWLLTRAMEVVPALKECPIAEMWTGFRPASADGLPLIGRGGLDGLYFLTGHGPSGIAPLPGSIALLMALIHNEPPPLSAAAFDPRRFESAP